MNKTCTKCNVEKPTTEYYKNPKAPDGLRHYCKACVKESNSSYYNTNKEAVDQANKAWRETHKEERNAAERRWSENNRDKTRLRARRWVLKTKYGITLEQYDAMLKAQDGKCAICGSEDPGGPGNNWHTSFAVDHCHDTGKVRQLLCQPCNTGLGMFKDAPALLQAAIDYIQYHK